MRRQRGVVLVVALATLAGLVAVLAGAAAAHDVLVKAEINRMEARRAQYVAMAGLQRAIASFDTGTPGVATQVDDWFTLGTYGADEFNLGTDSFRIQIVDGCSKINLNTATQQQLAKLPLTQDQIDCLLDWRTPGDSPRADGAKDDYYNNLSNPYNAKLRRLDSLDELLQVKGFTVDVVYQPQNFSGSNVLPPLNSNPNGNTPTNPPVTGTGTGTNAPTNPSAQNSEPTLYDLCSVDSVVRSTSPTGQARININAATTLQMQQRGIPAFVANAILARRRIATFTSLGQVLAIPQITGRSIAIVLDNFATDNATTHDGRINVNTASLPVLETLPGITPDIAQSIVSKQAQGIMSMNDLLSVPGINKQIMIPLADILTVNSSTYLVRVVGKAGGTTCTIEALLRTDGTTKKYVKITYPPYTDMTTRWQWSPSSNEIDLGSTQ